MAYKEHLLVMAYKKCYVVPIFQVVHTGKLLVSQPRYLCAKRQVTENGEFRGTQ